MVIMIFDNASSHVVSSVKVGKFFNLRIEQHDFGIPSSQCDKHGSTFGSRYNNIFQKFNTRRNFCGEFLSEYDDAILKDLRKMAPNIKQAIMWSYKVWSELDAQIIKNCWRMARILPPT